MGSSYCSGPLLLDTQVSSITAPYSPGDPFVCVICTRMWKGFALGCPNVEARPAFCKMSPGGTGTFFSRICPPIERQVETIDSETKTLRMNMPESYRAEAEQRIELY